MRSLVAALRHFVRPYRRALVVGIVLTLVEVGAGLAQPWPMKVIVDRVLTADDNRDAQALLAACIAALLAIVATGALADYWSKRLLSASGLWIANDLRQATFSHLHRLSLGFHSRNQVGDLSTRVTTDVDKTQELLVQTFATLGPNVLMVVGMFVVMLFVNPGLTLVALVASPLMVVTIVVSTRRLRLTARRARKAQGHVAAATTESLAAIHLVQAFALEPQQRQAFGALNQASLAESLEAARLQARFSPFVDLTSALSSAAVLWFGIGQVRAGDLKLGTLLVFVSYLGSLYRPVKAITKLAGTIGQGAASAERVHELLNEVPDVRESPSAVIAPRFWGDIEFRAVSFSYGREPVLSNLDLRLREGETVALVGRTGAGKSTVASLLARLIDPQAGQVLLDGTDIRSFTLASLRAQISFVLQDTLLMRGTLRDNIAWGRPGATEHEIQRAAALALVREFSCKLPLGLDTPIGERGVDLSGGQRQRVAIARAILRDAPILVLDEPTSALDATSEQQVVEAFHNLPSSRTRLVIAHRLTTVRDADRICVLDQGRIVEEGGHAALLAYGGQYAAFSGAGTR